VNEEERELDKLLVRVAPHIRGVAADTLKLWARERLRRHTTHHHLSEVFKMVFADHVHQLRNELLRDAITDITYSAFEILIAHLREQAWTLVTRDNAESEMEGEEPAGSWAEETSGPPPFSPDVWHLMSDEPGVDVIWHKGIYCSGANHAASPGFDADDVEHGVPARILDDGTYRWSK
jgi:hypothetical protein